MPATNEQWFGKEGGEKLTINCQGDVQVGLGTDCYATFELAKRIAGWTYGDIRESRIVCASTHSVDVLSQSVASSTLVLLLLLLMTQ